MIHCAGCEQQRELERTPRGWKRIGELYYCKRCWASRYVLRAIAMPITSVSDWKEFRTELAACWAQTTQASNWMMTELYARDIRRDKQEKLPRMKPVYLYPEARRLFPALPAQSVAAIERAVTAKYRRRRYGLLWTHSESLPSHRYPVPFPVHNQSWRCYFDGGNRPWINARVGEKRWELRLRGGARYRRQLAAFRQMVSGEAVRGELALYRIRQQEGPGYQIMAKMVAWLPRPTANALEGDLKLRTGPNHLLVALNIKDEKIWHYHGDQLLDWAAEQRRRRYAEDRKVEARPLKPSGSRRLALTKNRQRLRSTIHQASAGLAKYAFRRRFKRVIYRDEDRSFVEQFPWFELREKLSEKLDYYGIEFDHASSEATSETADPLAEGESL